MEAYPIGTRTLLKVCMATGLGFHGLYQFWLVRWCVILLDKFGGKFSSLPK